MHDDKDISNKSQMLTLVLLLLFGRLGLHRFYVGKYFTGLIYLLVGSTSIVLDVIGFQFALIAQVVYFLFFILDVYALYSDSFTDSKGRLLTSAKALEYDTYKERDRMLFDDKLNKILVILFGFAFYIVYLIVVNFVL
jgi:TM2 domain-containing membrane protein YozV